MNVRKTVILSPISTRSGLNNQDLRFIEYWMEMFSTVWNSLYIENFVSPIIYWKINSHITFIYLSARYVPMQFLLKSLEMFSDQ